VRGVIFTLFCNFTQQNASKEELVLEGSSTSGFHGWEGKVAL
jgi:hypothetical protein